VHSAACCARGAGRASLCTHHRSARRLTGADARARRARQVSPEEASRRIAAINEPYKQEILDGILARTPDAPITVYHIGGGEHAEHWWDLCGGPHVASTGKINPAAVDLESLAGAASDRLGCGPAPSTSPGNLTWLPCG
jgi:threonyl-tRNA synthetase